MITKRTLWSVLLLLSLPLVAQAQAENVDLKLTLSQGQSFKIRMSTSNTASTTVNRQPMKTVETLKFALQFTVAEVAPDGNYRLKAVFDNLSYSLAGAGEETDVMSGILTKAFAAVSGQSFEVRLNRAGLVLGVSGLESAVQAATQTLASHPEAARQIMTAFISQGLSEATWRQGLAQVFSVLPDGPVAIGERWSRKLAGSGQGLKWQSDLYCKILERSNGVAKVKVYYDIKSLEKSLAIGVTYSLSGTSQGTVDVEEATGLVLRGSLKSDVKGKAAAADTKGKRVPLTVTGTTTIKRER